METPQSPEEDVPTVCIISWPVLRYLGRGKVALQVLFIRNNNLVVIDPLEQKISTKKNLDEIEKISLDRNSTGVTDLSLFRISFISREVQIFFSKDTNEIVNAVSSQMKIRKREVIGYEQQEEEEYFKDEETEIQPSFSQYSYTVQSGFHQYQVFGIDNYGQFYPHQLGLFSHFIKHVDSKTKRIFSQHTYEMITHVETSHPHKISIHYQNDKAYTFIVSGEDHKEIVALLKGRIFVYELLHREDFMMEPEEEKDEPLSGLSSGNDFPSGFSYGTQTRANNEAYRYDPDMIHAMTVLSQQPGLRLGPVPLEQTGDINFGGLGFDDTLNADVHVNRIKLGMQVWKHIRKRARKQPKLKFCRVHDDLTLSWGRSRKVDKNRCISIVDIITGEEAQRPQNKTDPNFSFLIKSDKVENDLYLVARDVNEYANWVEGIKALLKVKKQHEEPITETVNSPFSRYATPKTPKPLPTL